ncbi:MAG: LemA family protein [gamma proteobacterium symbiont of Bathyaustriella thionipta]|nr:LemA family protein [gamma proteobacterium symbiont of Bathyaustriella thionipta]
MHEERIRRMQAEGTLTEQQAQVLLNSLSTTPIEKTANHAALRLPGRWLLLVLVLLFIGLLMLLLFNSIEPLSVENVSVTFNQPVGEHTMNKTSNMLIGIFLFLAVPVIVWVLLYNSLVSKEERVYESWAQVETAYQRRADLVPQLIDSVSRYLAHERQTFSDVVKARSAAISPLATVKDELIAAQKESTELLGQQAGQPPQDEAALAALAASQLKLGNRMRGFLGLLENYPELKSSDQFLTLQSQLEGSENRINAARSRFNEAVQVFNGAIRRMPASLVAGSSGFSRKAYFKSDTGAANAPHLKFD